ncbi:type III secretion system export apparatus subunit SctT [Salmonella enterica]|nr:EscT/YscT/HrcT family type III secretion system export apparatus protein [Salmonella enterica]ECC2863084.1 EscT/YscT/HrcT family type III secretion system export apparatus protein [Salmonella enterica subsp. enterica]EEO7875685.1 EscT/YscT/HrcT family type III secretion system export apparatus protein [Salmonella enterica]EHG3963385.1 EscT/YscT/HrcT family type III secretion system export apparatus protein [Salmonella enterica]EJZ1562344.1 type III secretion system export apparatus subunit S
MNDIINAMVSMFFCILRPLGAFIIFPLFSMGVLLTNFIRNSVIICLALPIFLQNYNFSERLPVGILSLASIAFKEIIIGFFIGLSFTIVFWAIDAAGQIIDTLRGSTISSIFNPAISDSSSVTGVLLYQFVTVIFIISGGLQSVLNVLYNSYELFPLDSVLTIRWSVVKFAFSLWESFISLMLSFSIPMVIGIFLCDMGFGFLNKTAPQLNVFTLSLPVKSCVSVFILLLVIHVFPDFINAGINADIFSSLLRDLLHE